LDWYVIRWLAWGVKPSRLLNLQAMNKSSTEPLSSEFAESKLGKAYVPSENTPIRNTFERIRSQLAQEAEQKSRPVSRLYPGLRALRA
jgi:hypothetical protein